MIRRQKKDTTPSARLVSFAVQAGLLTFGSAYRLRLPGLSASGIVQLSSPITAAGPSPIFTGFPFRLDQEHLNTPRCLAQSRQQCQGKAKNPTQAPLDPSRGLIIVSGRQILVRDSVRCAAGSPPRRPAAIVARTGAQGRVSRTFGGGPLRPIHRFSPAATPTASLTVCGHVRPTRPKGFGQRAPTAADRPPRPAGLMACQWRKENTRKGHQPSPVPLRGILAAADDCLRPFVPVAPDSWQGRRPSSMRSESCPMGVAGRGLSGATGTWGPAMAGTRMPGFASRGPAPDRVHNHTPLKTGAFTF